VGGPDVVSGEVVSELRLHQEAVRDVAWSPSDAVLVSGCLAGHTVEWRPTDFTAKPLTRCPADRARMYYY
jgi:hypothetical protein